jgi:hypothetical protein
VCDLENLKNEEAMTRVGSQRHRGEKYLEIRDNVDVFVKTCVSVRILTNKRRNVRLEGT